MSKTNIIYDKQDGSTPNNTEVVAFAGVALDRHTDLTLDDPDASLSIRTMLMGGLNIIERMAFAEALFDLAKTIITEVQRDVAGFAGGASLPDADTMSDEDKAAFEDLLRSLADDTSFEPS